MRKRQHLPCQADLDFVRDFIEEDGPIGGAYAQYGFVNIGRWLAHSQTREDMEMLRAQRERVLQHQFYGGMDLQY